MAQAGEKQQEKIQRAIRRPEAAAAGRRLMPLPQ